MPGMSAAAQNPAALQLLQRAVGPPTSAVQGFWVPALPQLQLYAYGASGGAVVVALHPPGQQQDPPPLVLNLRRSSGQPVDQDVTAASVSVHYGSCLVAAAAGTTLGVLCLDAYVAVLTTLYSSRQHQPRSRTGSCSSNMQSASDDASATHVATVQCDQLCSVRHSAGLAAVEWTQAGDGVLCADEAAHVTMYSLVKPSAGRESTAARSTAAVLQAAWTGRSSTITQPQTLISAGADVNSPSASAVRHSKVVTVWWPAFAEQPTDAATNAAQTSRQSAAQAAMGEQLRHPAGVLGLQWSPGVLQQGCVPEDSDSEDEYGASEASQPALLTVSADGAIRIWVEVTLAPTMSLAASAPGSPKRSLPSLTNPKTPQPAAPMPAAAGKAPPGSPKSPRSPRKGRPAGTSHFCVALVVQAPALDAPVDPSSFKTCWGVPQQAGRPNSMASRVLWVAAAANLRHEETSERLLLWAVTGLAGVVISGIPNSIASGRLAVMPKAILWGQHTGELVWPTAACRPGSPSCVSHLACGVFLENGAPELHFHESRVDVQHGTAHLRSFQMSTVEGESSVAGIRCLPLHSLGARSLLGHSAPIQQLACCARYACSANYMATLDSHGAVLLWRTAQLSPMAAVALAEGPVTAIAWVVCPCCNQAAQRIADHISSASAPENAGGCWSRSILAAAHASGVSLIAVDQIRGSGVMTRVVGHLALPEGYQRVRTLHTLDTAGTAGAAGTAAADTICIAAWVASNDTASTVAEPAQHTQYTLQAASAESPSALALWAIPVEQLTAGCRQARTLTAAATAPGPRLPSEQGGPSSELQAGSARGPGSHAAAADGFLLQAAAVQPLGAVSSVAALPSPAFQLVSAAAHGHLALWAVARAQAAENAAGLVLQDAAASVQLPSQSGVPVAIATSACGSFMACACTGAADGDDTLFILTAHTAPALQPSYFLEAVVKLPDTPSALAWLPSAKVGLTPAVALSCSGSGVSVIARSHDGSWQAVARSAELGLPTTALALYSPRRTDTCLGLPSSSRALSLPGSSGSAADSMPGTLGGGESLGQGVDMPDQQLIIAAGNQLAVAGDSVKVDREVPRNARLAQLGSQIGGPLPDFHPDMLHMLIARGRIPAAVTAIRLLLTWLRSATSAATPGHVKDAASAALQRPFAELHQLLDTSLSQLARQVAADAQQGKSEQQPQPQQSRSAASALDSGMLDMSAFGTGYQPEPQQQQPTTSAASAVESGMLDMSAFSMGYDPEPQQQRSSPVGAVESGRLDMSAFGLGYSPEPAQQQPEPSSSAAVAVESGMLDMSAFGMEHGAEPEQPPQQRSCQHSGLGSGMLDMAAFGMDYVPEPQQQEPASSSAAAAVESGMLDMSAFGMDVDTQPMSRKAAQQTLAPANPLSKSATMSSQLKPPAVPAVPAMPKHTKQAPKPAEFQPLTAAELAELQQLLGLTQRAKQGQQHPTAQRGKLFDKMSNGLGVESEGDEEGSGGESDPEERQLKRQRRQQTQQAQCADAAAALLGLRPAKVAQLACLAQILCSGGAIPVAAGQLSGKQLAQAPVVDLKPLDLPARHALLSIEMAAAALESIPRPAQQAGQEGHASPAEVPGGALHKSSQASSLAKLPTAAGPRASVLSFSSLANLPALDNPSPAPAHARLGQLDTWSREDPAAAWQERRGLLPGADMRTVAWALVSETQEALLGACLQVIPVDAQEEEPNNPKVNFTFAGEAKLDLGFDNTGAGRRTAALSQSQGPRPITWDGLRKAGAGFWLTDPRVVRATADALAKAQFATAKDPHAAALMYLALGKRALLQGLFRSSQHKKLADFMSRNFEDAAHRAAACKNAYVLLGQHRPELAAAFFILGGAQKDAVGVCVHELSDPQLALFVCRLLEGGNGQLHRQLITAELLPEAEAASDHWAVCTLRWLAGEPLPALQHLLSVDAASPADAEADNPGESAPARMHQAISSASTRPASATAASGPATCSRSEPASRSASAHEADTAEPATGDPLALDFAQFCILAFGFSPAQLRLCPTQLLAVAIASARAFDTGGYSVMALEMLHMAALSDPSQLSQAQQVNSAQSSRELGAMHKQAVMEAWRTRVAAACLVRCFGSLSLLRASPAASTASGTAQEHMPLPAGWVRDANEDSLTASQHLVSPVHVLTAAEWHKEAAQQLQQLEEAGISVNQGEVLCELASLAVALDLDTTPAEHADAIASTAHASHRSRPTVQVDAIQSAAEDPSVVSPAPASPTADSKTSERQSKQSELKPALSLPSVHSVHSSARSGMLYDTAPRSVLHVHGDRLLNMCCSNTDHYGELGHGRPVVAASAHHGLVETQIAAPAKQTLDEEASTASLPCPASPAASAASESVPGTGGNKGSAFSLLLSDMLEAVRWPPDPWAVLAPPASQPTVLGISGSGTAGSTPGGDGSQVAASNGIAGGASVAAPLPGGQGRTVCSSRQAGDRGSGQGDGDGMERLQVKASSITTSALASHPIRPLYLSGSSSGEVYLWHFGDKQATAGYTPLVGSATSPPASPASMFSAPAKTWNPHMPGVSLSHWGKPQAVRFSDCGERFAAVGEGGLVATWRLHAPRHADSTTGPLGRADWIHQALSKRGADVVYVGGSSSVLAVGGHCSKGGNIVLMDTLAPAAQATIARLSHHSAPVTALQMLPGGRLLVSADEAGAMAVKDLRMLGGSGSGSSADQRLVWEVKAGQYHLGGVTRLAVTFRPSGSVVVVSGSKDGFVHIWSAHHGHLRQSMEAGQLAAAAGSSSLRQLGKSFFADALKPRQSSAAAVTGLTACPEGLLVAVGDGPVLLYPLVA